MLRLETIKRFVSSESCVRTRGHGLPISYARVTRYIGWLAEECRDGIPLTGC